MKTEDDIFEIQVKIVELLENIEKQKENLKSTGAGTRAMDYDMLKAIREQSKDAARAIVSFQQEIKKAEAEIAKTLKDLEERTNLVSKNMMGAGLAIGNFGFAMASQSNTVTSSFKALVPAVKLASTAMSGFGKLLGVGFKVAAAGVFAGTGGAGAAFSAGLYAAGEKIGEHSEKSAELFASAATWYLESLDKVVQTTAALSKSGALGAGGIDQLTMSANRAGISYEELNSVVKDQSSNLAFVYGNVAAGIDTIAAASRQIKDSGEMLDLRKLGYSPEEIVDLMSQFAHIQVMTGRRKELDDKKLRTGTLEYVKNLDILSRLTGQQQEVISKQIRDMTREERFGQFLETLDKGAKERMMTTAVLMQSAFGEKFAQLFKDAAPGPAPGNEAFFVATGVAGMDIFRAIQDNMEPVEAVEKMRDILISARQDFGGPGALSQFGGQGTILSDFYEAMKMAETGRRLTMEDVTRAQEKLYNSTEGASANLAEAADIVHTMSLEINKKFIETLPKAGETVNWFADTTKIATEKMIEIINAMSDMRNPNHDWGPASLISGVIEDIQKAAGDSGWRPWNNTGAGNPRSRTGGSGGLAAGLNVLLNGRYAGGKSRAIEEMLDLIPQYESTSHGSLVYKVDPFTGKKYSGGEADLTNMTLAEVEKLQSGMKARGHATTAVGRYQTVKDTMKGAATALGYDFETTKYTPDVQRAVGAYLIEQRMLAESKKKSPTVEGFMQGMGSEWAPFKTNPEAKAKLEEIIKRNGMEFGNRGASVGPRNRYVPFNNSTLNPDDFNKAAPQGVASATTKNIPDLLSEQIDINRMQTIQLAELIDQSRKNNTGIENLIRVSVG